MIIRTSGSVLRASIVAAAVMLFALITGSSALAAGTTDAELRGYKGGLVEIGLNNGTTVRGMLYGYTSEHLELEVAKGRTAKLHRSRVKWLKAAPAGAGRSVLGAFPADAALPASSGAPRTTPPPRATPDSGPPVAPPRANPDETPDSPPPGPIVGKHGKGPKAKGFVFELKFGGTLYTPYVVSAYHPATPVSADVLVGYKFGRFVIGARLDFALAETDEGSGDTARMTMIIVAPTFQFTLMDSWPLSMYGTLSIDVGPGIAGAGGDNDVLLAIGFRAGAGLRYFVHPRFAVGAETGFRGLWLLGDLGIGHVSIYGQASMYFIW